MSTTHDGSSKPTFIKSPHTRLLFAGLVLGYAVIGLLFVAAGRPNIDEGIFLSAAGRVFDGEQPYRDFPFSQAPMLPYFYALAPPILGSALMGARLFSWLAGVTGMTAILWLTRRVAGDLAAITTLLVTFATLPVISVGMAVRSQSIGIPLLLLGVASLALPRKSGWSFVLAPSLLLWATGMRLTNALVFAAVCLWVVWQLRRKPSQLAGIGALLGAQAVLIGLPILRAPADAFFHLITAQLTRSERFGYMVELPLLGEINRKLVAYSDLTADAWLLLLLAIPLVAAGLRSWYRGWRPQLAQPMGDPKTAIFTLTALGLLAFAPHWLLDNAFLEYLLPLWALMTPAIGIGMATWLHRKGSTRRLRFVVVGALLACALANAYFDRNIWIGSGDSSFRSFHRTSQNLAKAGGNDCTVLTFQTQLAVEAGCRVLPGLDYSLFSYFPGLSAEEATAKGVLSLELLRQRVAQYKPDLIVVGRADPSLLLGTETTRHRGQTVRRLRRSKHPLEFLGEHRSAYRPYASIQIPSALGRAGGSDMVSLRVFRKKDADRGGG